MQMELTEWILQPTSMPLFLLNFYSEMLKNVLMHAVSQWRIVKPVKWSKSMRKNLLK